MDGKKYRTLTPPICKLLYSIWQRQSQPGNQGAGATLEEIATMLQRTKNYVSGIIYQVKNISEDYLVGPMTYFPHDKEGQPGRPLSYYYLNQREFVTNAKTALILLELSTYPQEANGYIDREKFVRYLIDFYGLDEVFVQARITWAIEKEYLYADNAGSIIWPHERITCERAYLELLAQHDKSEGGLNA